jgi:hypothetical protein
VSIVELMQRILNKPTADDLWELHPYLLSVEGPEAESTRELARTFYCYLSYVQSKLSSKQYSLIAATLAAGSVGVIAVQDLIRDLDANPENTIRNLLVGGLAESMELLSTFQHVKAWETEFASVHQEAIWNLYAALWQLSVETQPDLSLDRRRQLADTLLSYIRDADVNANVRMALIIRLFQVLFVIRLSLLFAAEDALAAIQE